MPVCFTDSHVTGIMKATMMMMYCAICVHVMARIPPKKEQTKMLANPRKIPTEKSMPVKRDVISPTP